LNIIGGVQPRGVRKVGIAKVRDVLELAIGFNIDDAAIPIMLDCNGMLAVLAILLPFAIKIKVAVAPIMVDEEVIIIVITAICLASIPAMVMGARLNPRPVPASRIYSGRHRT